MLNQSDKTTAQGINKPNVYGLHWFYFLLRSFELSFNLIEAVNKEHYLWPLINM